jgi:hypothetical protein
VKSPETAAVVGVAGGIKKWAAPLPKRVTLCHISRSLSTGQIRAWDKTTRLGGRRVGGLLALLLFR